MQAALLFCSKAKEKIPHLKEENPLPHEYLIDSVNTVNTELQ